jgi:pyruvate dehydrogenase E2 component (dihydrolipoamide acetyltransferase)
MIREVRLPEISENVESGDVIKILVSVGDAVGVDQPLLELETDKAVLEVPSPHKGKVAEILVRPGETVKVGQVFMTIDTADTSAGDVVKPAGEPRPETREPRAPVDSGPRTEAVDKRPVKQSPTSAVEKAGERTVAAGETLVTPEAPPLGSPAVRRLARELGVDLRCVKGRGEGGRILEADLKEFAKHAVEEAVQGPGATETPAAAEPGKWGPIVREPMSKIRQVTARTMSEAWKEIPHVTQHDKADITSLDAALKKYGVRVEKAGGKLTITAVLLKVAASALRVFPKFNASIDAEKQEIIYKKYYHIGVAVDTDRGLLVPVIRNVDTKNVTQLSLELTAIADRARARKIVPDELEGGTFTVTNLGGIGGTGFTPIVYPPQVAILGSARAQLEPVYIDGRLEPRLVLPLCVSYDHRIVDGADAARFLRWIAQALEEPILMWLEG